MIRKCLSNNIIDFYNVNERICILRLRAKFFNISIICVRAPTEDIMDEQKDILCDKLHNEFDEIPRDNVKIIIGDFNTNIRKKKYTFIPKLENLIYMIFAQKME